MRSQFKAILKVILGGFCAVLIFLSFGIVKDVFNSVRLGQHCDDLIYIPIKLAFSLIYIPLFSDLFYVGWGDWEIFVFFLGGLIVLIAQFRLFLVNHAYSKKVVRSIFAILLVMSLVFAGFEINLEKQKETSIMNTYLGFCRALEDQDYDLAYSYFSPEVRRQTQRSNFIQNDIKTGYYSLYCYNESVGPIFHRGNDAAVFLASSETSACTLLIWGEAPMLKRIKGKWYFIDNAYAIGQ